MKKTFIYIAVAAVAVAIAALALSHAFGGCRVSTEKAPSDKNFPEEKFNRVEKVEWGPSALDILPHEETEAERYLKDLPAGSEVIHTSHGDIVRSPEGEYYVPKEGGQGELVPFEGEITVFERTVPPLALEIKPFGGAGYNTRRHPEVVAGATLLRIKDRAAVGGFASLDTVGGQVGAGIAAAVPVVWRLNAAAGVGVDFAVIKDGSLRAQEKEFKAFAGVVLQ